VSRKAQTKAWSNDIDPATIPVEVLISQLEPVAYDAILLLLGRKNVAKRTRYTEEYTWPNTIRIPNVAGAENAWRKDNASRGRSRRASTVNHRLVIRMQRRQEDECGIGQRLSEFRT
jgi:hypothetical protein